MARPTKYTKKQREQILILRDKEDESFSIICKKMKLSQREARNLYTMSKKGTK